MEIGTGDAAKLSLHLITIITLLYTNQRRVAAKVLLHQCCTNKGLISWDLANALGIPASTGDERTFTTAVGTFSTTKFLQLTRAMLLCLSTNHTFSMELMIVPQECSADLNYGIVLGQDTMRALDLNTSICNNTISWGEELISMVPYDYWTTEQILQQKARLTKQQKLLTEKIVNDEVFLSEALTPVTYTQANLEQIVRNCTDLEIEQQSSLLQILPKHQT